MTTVMTSYWPADASAPVNQTTVGGVLRAAAAAGPGMLAMVGGLPDPGARKRWTYAQLLAEAERAARALTARFDPGERVAVWAPNLPEWVVLEYAAAMAGLVLVTVNPAYRPAELAYVLNQSGAAGRGRATGALPGAPGAVQDAPALGVRGRLPDDPVGQDPEVQAAGKLRSAPACSTPAGLTSAALSAVASGPEPGWRRSGDSVGRATPLTHKTTSSPQLANIATSTPNRNTLLMNPGDKLTIHIWDAPVPGGGGQKALETQIVDNTTGQTGFMQASAANGFMATNINDCSGTPFNYEPEYNTSGVKSITPWAALQVDVSTQFEIGHFEACTTVTKPLNLVDLIQFPDIAWNQCHGPYENSAPKGAESFEPGDGFCYPAGWTHAGQAPPNIVTGCLDNFFQNGDLDFDGNPYWPDWPNSTTPNTFPPTFQQSAPTTVGGKSYSQFQIQTDAALSESSCNFPDPSGCKVPPPTAPGHFYPYWTLTSGCALEFGNMTNGNNFGKFAQYGTIIPAVGYPELFGRIMSNPC